MTQSVLEIASDLIDNWPYARGIKSAHKSMLIAMIAEALSEQRKQGYRTGMMKAEQICNQEANEACQDSWDDGRNCGCDACAKAIRAEAEKEI